MFLICRSLTFTTTFLYHVKKRIKNIINHAAVETADDNAQLPVVMATRHAFSWKDLSLEIELKGKKCCYVSALRVKAAQFSLTFLWLWERWCPAAEYFICREKLSNVAMTGTELNRYLKHVSLAS